MQHYQNRGGGYYISALANVETPEVYYTEVIRIKCAHSKESSLYWLYDMYMCFRRNSILICYEILLSNHWIRTMMATYSSYEVLLRTVPMLPCESRKVVRAVPSLEPSFKDLFDQRSVA